jgi:hypothetical protein
MPDSAAGLLATQHKSASSKKLANVSAKPSSTGVTRSKTLRSNHAPSISEYDQAVTEELTAATHELLAGTGLTSPKGVVYIPGPPDNTVKAPKLPAETPTRPPSTPADLDKIHDNDTEYQQRLRARCKRITDELDSLVGAPERISVSAEALYTVMRKLRMSFVEWNFHPSPPKAVQADANILNPSKVRGQVTIHQ